MAGAFLAGAAFGAIAFLAALGATFAFAGVALAGFTLSLAILLDIVIYSLQVVWYSPAVKADEYFSVGVLCSISRIRSSAISQIQVLHVQCIIIKDS